MGVGRGTETGRGVVLIVGRQGDGGCGWIGCRGKVKRIGWKRWCEGEGHWGLRVGNGIGLSFTSTRGNRKGKCGEAKTGGRLLGTKLHPHSSLRDDLTLWGVGHTQVALKCFSGLARNAARFHP